MHKSSLWDWGSALGPAGNHFVPYTSSQTKSDVMSSLMAPLFSGTMDMQMPKWKLQNFLPIQNKQLLIKPIQIQNS